jgi:signal peptidase I
MDILKEFKEIIIAVILVLVLYNGLSFVLGTTVPVTSIVSQSMQHSSNFEEWWAFNEGKYSEFNITKESFSSFPYKDGLYIGDMIVVAKAEQINIGDVIVYHPADGCFPGISSKETIIHRVVSTDPILTKGDNNPSPDLFREKSCVTKIEGKAVLGLPLLGYPRLLLFQLTGV